MAAPFGVYVHIPFCAKRCDYCAFATWTDRIHLADRYIRACVRELQAVPAPATSVYFGGGTPSLLSPSQLATILGAVPVAGGAEITVECNPDTVDAAKLAGYRSAGVTRLSFGVQSMASHVLASLGRSHTAGSIAPAAAAAGQVGFGDSYSVDLIYGAAGESLADWRATVEGVLRLDPAPSHVSAYGLTVEAGTPLAATPDRHPDPDDQAEKYLVADEMFEAAGLRWYEISNWARPGSECRHNQLYWEQGEYLGVGCSSHSHQIDTAADEARRWWNVRPIERYIEAIESKGSAEAGGETLSGLTRATEALELSLRTCRGVPTAALPGWNQDPVLNDLVEPARPDRLRLTSRGRLLANEVSLRLEPVRSSVAVG